VTCFQGSLDLEFPCCIDHFEGGMSPSGLVCCPMFEGIVLPPASICYLYLDNATSEGKDLPLVLVLLHRRVLLSSMVLQQVPKGLHMGYCLSDQVPLYSRHHSMHSSLLDLARDLWDQSCHCLVP